jgi:hypothetical protein
MSTAGIDEIPTVRTELALLHTRRAQACPDHVVVCRLVRTVCYPVHRIKEAVRSSEHGESRTL